MLLFTKLFLAHLIGDFLLQPNKWVIDKEKNKLKSKYLYFHVLIHFAFTMLLLWDWSYWKIALLIMVTHFIIDSLKLYIAPNIKNTRIPFFIDQTLHLIVLYVCAYYGDLLNHTTEIIQQVDITLVTAFVFVSFPAAIIIGKLLEGMSKHIEVDHESLPNAGMYYRAFFCFGIYNFRSLGSNRISNCSEICFQV